MLMKSVAILPLRAGSKGIPGKNKKRILGRPLYLWVLAEAIFSRLDEVYVFTDDRGILDFIEQEFSWTNKVKGVLRSSESATDTASTEQAMVELAKKINYDFDIYCLLQATSPLTKRSDINAVIDSVSNKDYDSALSVVETKRFVWNDRGESLNYDYNARPRRQDFNGMLIENGAVYATTKTNFKATNNRLGGQIATVKMSEDTLIEIDEPSDFTVVSQLITSGLQLRRSGLSNIRILCLDVDGVFTKGTLTVSPEGEHTKEFSLRDGMGMQLLRENGVEIIVMTSENSPIVQQRMNKLNIEHTFMGVRDKYAFLDHVLQQRGLSRAEVAYVGDDINDLANIASCGLGLCPNDAEPAVKSHAFAVLNKKGGERVIREACEFIMNYNKRF